MKLFRKKIIFAAAALLILIAASTVVLAEEGSRGDQPAAMGPCEAWSPPQLDLETAWDAQNQEICVSVSTPGWENVGVLCFCLTYPGELLPVEQPTGLAGLEGSGIVWNEDGLYVLWVDAEGCAMPETELLAFRLDASASEAEEWTVELSDFCFSDCTGSYNAKGNTGVSISTVAGDLHLPEAEEETEALETELAETEPAETEPAETEAAETEPAETEAAETEPAETEAVKSEPETPAPASDTSPSGEAVEETIQAPENEPGVTSETEFTSSPEAEAEADEVFE